MDPIANFSGLASGIQWHDMIDQIMKLEAARSVDPLTNRVSTQTARIDAWKVYEGLVSKLKSASLALRDGASFGIYNATASTNAAGRALVSATASSTATPGSYRVEVIELARAEKLNGRNEASTTTALGLSGQFFINGRAVDIAATDTLNQVRDKINAVNSGSSASGVTATILTTGTDAHRLILTADQTGSRGIELVDSASGGGVLQDLGILDGTLVANTSPTDSSRTESQRFTSSASQLATMLGVSPAPAQTSIKINGQKIDVDLANDTMIDIMNRVAAAGGSASLVQETIGGQTQYRLSVGGTVEADTDVGVDAAASQRVVELLGFQTSGRPGEITAGSDAIASIDGFRVTRRTNVISDAIAGVSINLLAADATGRSAATTSADLDIVTDPRTISPGTYAVNFEATSARTATSSAPNLAITSQTGVDSGAIADGTYAVELSTTTTRSTSASSADLSVSNAPASWAPGTYAVDATVTRTQSASSAYLTTTAADTNVAAGTYSVDVQVTRTASASSAYLQATAAGSNIAAGTYNIEATSTRTATTTLSSGSVLTADASVAAGSYGVSITQAATRSSATGTVVNATYAGTTGDTMTIRDNVTGLTHVQTLTTGETLNALVSKMNAEFSAKGLRMTASNVGGYLKLEHSDYGSAGSFTVTNSHNRVATNYGLGSVTGTTSANGVNVAGTIGGAAATGSGQTLTGSGALAGLSVRYTSTSNTATGAVTVTDTVTGGTVGGQAATWDSATQTLTTASGVAVQYTGPASASSLGGTSSAAVGSVTLTDTVSGGSLGGQAATWDPAARTLTDANGMVVQYTGSAPAGSLAGTVTANAGNVTISDAVTGGTIGGTAATWDSGSQTFTTADGMAVRYTGPMGRGTLTGPATSPLGDVTITDLTEITGGTIGGEAAVWDDTAKTLTAGAGTAAEGLTVAYSGPVTSGAVGSVVVETTTTLDGVTIDGEAADWDAATGTIRGRDGSRFEALELSYSGAASYSGSAQSTYAGDLVISGDVGVDLTISRDTAGTVASIQAYVDAYNGIRDFVGKQQSSADVLATNGTLRSTARSLTDVMLDDVDSLVGTGFSRAANAGVALDRDGRLTLDSSVLTSALQESPNDVRALFEGVGASMYSASDAIAASFTGTVASQIRSLEESNASLALRIDDAEARLEVRRQSMIRQYTQMETMISQIQSQGNWLSQQIQSLQPSDQ